jgi:two-component system NtrC family sensor kinase
MASKSATPRAASVRRPRKAVRGSPADLGPEHVSALSYRLLHDADNGLPRSDYVARALATILEFSGAGAASLWLREGPKVVRFSATAARLPSLRVEIGDGGQQAEGLAGTTAGPERLARMLLLHPDGETLPGLTPGGSLVTDDPKLLGTGRGCRALALVQIHVGGEQVGIMELRGARKGAFPAVAVEAYERLAPILGCALVSQRAQAAVQERVKELTCLYGITQLTQRPEMRLEQVVGGIVRLLPPAWQYPEVAVARVVLDEQVFATPSFRRGAQRQSAEIVVGGVSRGSIEVSYARRRPEADEGPFLKEERSLIDAVARQLAAVVERREAAAESARLQEQLRHADRLATIGQLAAGVAHELNEPLGNILGFAQLAKKGGADGASLAGDLDKIVAAAMHAREIVRKLVLFARQTPPTKARVNLNAVIAEGLYLVEARCAKEGVELVRRLEPDLPDIVADSSQLHQVLVNLAVNAVQAMPGGGRLTIRTRRADGHVALVVEDTGCGMTEEVRRQIFIPFFTTKDVSEGTGLGLAVVHGIVSAHGGTITVASEPGRGTRFEILLPLAGLATFKEADPDAVFW